MRGPRTAMKSGPRSPQLEKAFAQKRRPNTAKNKLINQLKKKGVSQIKQNKTKQNKKQTKNNSDLLNGFLGFFLYTERLVHFFEFRTNAP